ncbi:acetyltransferase [Dipodascopsis tothii]|uniref:acetyltransferase n=1 Tax=Dipodascopsis tothii TaxID=44089 RepID=UPI0034D01B40
MAPLGCLENLDVLGHQPSLHKLYTQICSVFAGDADRDAATKTLRDGLDALAAAFPWVCGDVVNTGAGPNVTGTFKIVARDQIPLVVRDLTTDPAAPTVASLRAAKYPFRLLDEKLIAPCMTLNPPGTAAGLVAETGPVLAVQINFIVGGVVLTVASQHNAMDMVGQGNVMRWLSQACAGVLPSAADLAAGNADKRASVPLMDAAWQPGSDLDHQMARPPVPAAARPTTWAYVRFSAAALGRLKAAANATKDADVDFVSTDDAATALLWQCVTRARAPRLKPDAVTTFGRAVDVRPFLHVPDSYPGALSNMVFSSFAVPDLATASLGAVASALRRQLYPRVYDVAYRTRALATLLDRSPDKTVVALTAPVDAETGIMLSSWAKVDVYALDFGLGLGKPEAVRRPRFLPIESLGYIMPKAPDGELVIGIGLCDDDWTRLGADAVWNEYAEYVG